MAGFVKAKLTIKDQKIAAVDLDLSTETPQYGQKAEKQLKNEILTNQSADIDAVSGATFTSNGVKEAVADALKQATKQRKINARYNVFCY
ncbi:FMN-binding protein [Lactobacillus helveticus]|nr:FMN-binding protein [Lactobacillus helveticus]MBW8013105.1 FMN-binding protein [Lactobacillus helveticus]